jgi:hypothetical protein
MRYPLVYDPDGQSEREGSPFLFRELPPPLL